MKDQKIKIKRISQDVMEAKIDVDENVKSNELQRQKKMFQSKKKFYKMNFWDRRKLKTKPEISYLITMRFKNGTRKTFVITSKDKTFKFQKKLYYLYYEEAFYDISMNQYHLDYFSDIAVPINREVIQQGEEAFFSVTPDNLEPLIKYEYVKVLAGSHSFDKMLRLIVILQFVNIIMTAVTLLMNFQKGQ